MKATINQLMNEKLKELYIILSKLDIRNPEHKEKIKETEKLIELIDKKRRENVEKILMEYKAKWKNLNKQ